MVAAYISGRLGNQLFQYAFFKAIKLAQGSDEPMIFNFNNVYACGKAQDGFEDSLQYFCVEEYKTDNRLLLHYCSISQFFLYVLYLVDSKLGYKIKKIDSWFSIFRNHGLIFVRRNLEFSQKSLPVFRKLLDTGRPRKVICYGCFEVPELFDHIKPILIKEFIPKFPPMTENKELYEIINSTNSICVSIRRGDYLSDRFKSQFFICDKSYYDIAIKKIKEMVENPVFIFFSDDIQWVKRNIYVDNPCYYESGKDPVWEKLRLMYSCKHFIISNSTFSWWAQYLSRNTDNKVVISPDHWFNGMNYQSPLISKDFYKITLS